MEAGLRAYTQAAGVLSSNVLLKVDREAGQLVAHVRGLHFALELQLTAAGDGELAGALRKVGKTTG